MSRLLFAAARGARLQTICYNLTNGKQEWRDTYSVESADRIHPDDEHLQYGPISSALREPAIEYQTLIKTTHGWFGLNNGYEWDLMDCDDKYQKYMFLLFLAEALADEGL